MDECPQPVYDDIEEMADGENENEHSPTHIGPACYYIPQKVDDHGDDPRGKSEGE